MKQLIKLIELLIFQVFQQLKNVMLCATPTVDVILSLLETLHPIMLEDVIYLELVVQVIFFIQIGALIGTKHQLVF